MDPAAERRPPAPAQALPDFLWSVGEECSDPMVQREGRPHRVDQLGQSRHLEHQEEDLKRIRALGVRHVRYGMPWRLSETAPGRFDWTLWDRAIAGCEAAELEPIVDLLHFGLPNDCAGFADPAWIDRFVGYVEAFLDRFPGLRYFTPVNEPGFTAMMSGLAGAWNDRLRSREDYARVLSHVTLANLEAIARIRADRDGVWISAESFNVPVAVAPGADVEAEVERRRALGWLVWDLHLGIDPLPAAQHALEAIDPAIRERIDGLAVRDGLLAGHDFYPLGLQAIGGDEPAWTIDERLDLYEAEARRWHERYGVPFWISETSNFSLPTRDQTAWLDGFVARLANLRRDGLPARGLCWYSRGDQYDWQTFLNDPCGRVTEVGLFDEDRRERPVAGPFARVVRAGAPEDADLPSAAAARRDEPAEA